MIGRIVAWGTRHNRLLIAAALAVAVGGEWSRRSLARDAVPDLSDPQIGLVADWMGHPATEVASAITQVLTDALRTVPGTTAVRGASMAGMAYVDVVFDASARLGPGRQEIVRRVDGLASRLPATIRLQVGPPASATGWIYQYALVGSTGKSLALGRFVQDEILRPALEAIPGVAEVASVGETSEQVLVETNVDQLRARALAFSDLVAALHQEAHGNPDVFGIEALPLRVTRGGKLAQLQIGDVAHASIATDMPIGIADLNGSNTVAGGIVVARRDADPKAVIEAIESQLSQLHQRLAGHVQIVTVYSRLDLARRVEHTLLRALTEEVGVVVLVVLLFLLHLRSALVPLVTLPLVLCLTFAGMRLFGIPATIMSLGGIGIALGMAVDADVVALEACHRRLESLRGSSPARGAALVEAAGALVPAVLTSLLITALSFLPVLAFGGETGRLLRPLALSKTLVIVSAALVAVTAAPALRAQLLRGRILPEFDHPLTRGLVRLYRPFVRFALARPTLTLTSAALAVASCLPIVGRLGGEFLPRVDEGDLLFMPTTLPGAPAGEAAVQLRTMDRTIAGFPEVASVFGKVGRADSATDPAPFSMAEVTIRLKPRAQWPTVQQARWYTTWAPAWLGHLLGLCWPEQRPETTAELIDKLDRASRFPGWVNAWTAPARARMDMMSTGGVRTPVGIRVVAESPDRLEALGAAVQTWVTGLPGTRSAVFESLGGEPWLVFDLDAEALARHQVEASLARSTAELVVSGGQIGELTWQGPPLSTWRPSRFIVGHAGHHGQGDARPSKRPYRLRVAADMSMKRPDADLLREITVSASDGRPVALGLLGHPRYRTVPAAIRSENGELVAYVYVDLSEGSDVASYVERARADLGRALAAGEIGLGPRERLEWTGQYHLMAAGQRRLAWIVPLVALSMLVLLFLQFRNLTEALIVLVAVPFALVGSVWTLFLLRYPLSAPVWVGLLSAVGLAMQTGVVMVVYIDQAFRQRMREGRLNQRADIIAAHAEGTVRRLRPKLMTVTTMAAGLLPLLWAEGAGAEIMRRVAAPMLGGLATSAFLTLEVLPVIYTIWRARQLRRAVRLGVPLATLVDGKRARAASPRQDPDRVAAAGPWG